MSELRTIQQRKSDVIATLERNGDAWLATASGSGRPHLVAVSSWWDGSRIVIATRRATQSARNLGETALGRLALGTPDDVIVLDVTVGESVAVAGADPALAAGFVAAVGWNPADEGPDWWFYALSPVRVQASRGYAELQGRDVMREGRWLA